MSSMTEIGSRTDALIGSNYSVLKFKDMSVPYQMSIVWYMAVEGSAWDGVDYMAISHLDENDFKAALVELLPKFVEVYGDELFGSVLLSAESLKNAVMQDEGIKDSYSSWDDYHKPYAKSSVENFSPESRWPVRLSCDNSETLRDGWKRFNTYIRAGNTDIPAVFIPYAKHVRFLNQKDQNNQIIS